MAERYTKTETGRAEIRARVHALTRTARNLLLIIDSTKDGDQWVGLVQGATTADLQTLVDAGLIGPATEAPSSLPPASQPSASQPPSSRGSSVPAEGAAVHGLQEPAPLESQAALSYSDLYDLLPGLAKEHLGMIKSYKFVLTIEKANGLAGLQEVARNLVAEIERAKGPAVARSVKRALLLG